MSEAIFPNPFHVASAFVLPEDKARLKRMYWTPNEAARAWGCSRATAYRLIDRYERQLGARLIWVVRPGKTELWRVIPANSERPKPPKGNPMFRDSDAQARTARAREKQRRAQKARGE